MHSLKQRAAELVALQQMTEPEHRRLVGRWLLSQVDAGERLHTARVVERFFDVGVGQVEPLLKEVDTEHLFKVARRAAIAALG